MIKALEGNFQLTQWQDTQKDGRGYKLHLKAIWNCSNLDVRSIQVQLVGIDPLTGEDVAAENLVATFSFDRRECEINRRLTYHGKFVLRCTAVRGSGEQVEFREQPILLECEEGKPWITYSVCEEQGFQRVEIRSNCWKSCKGKVWMNVDGHNQRIDLPAGPNNVVRFYVAGSQILGKLSVQNKQVTLRQER